MFWDVEGFCVELRGYIVYVEVHSTLFRFFLEGDMLRRHVSYTIFSQSALNCSRAVSLLSLLTTSSAACYSRVSTIRRFAATALRG